LFNKNIPPMLHKFTQDLLKNVIIIHGGHITSTQCFVEPLTELFEAGTIKHGGYVSTLIDSLLRMFGVPAIKYELKDNKDNIGHKYIFSHVNLRNVTTQQLYEDIQFTDIDYLLVHIKRVIMFAQIIHLSSIK
jgi:hypothetical protein